MKNRFKMLAIGVTTAMGLIASDAQALECCYKFRKQGTHFTVSGEIYGLHYCKLVDNAERLQILALIGTVTNAIGSVRFSVAPRVLSSLFSNNSCDTTTDSSSSKPYVIDPTRDTETAQSEAHEPLSITIPGAK